MQVCILGPQVKADFEAIYSQYGMSITDAINVFLYQSRNIDGLPFDLHPQKPNAETLAAMKEETKLLSLAKDGLLVPLTC